MKTRLLSTTQAAFAAVTLLGALAPAQANLLSNGSFEGPFVTNTYCYGCAAGGWSGPAVMINAASGSWGTPQGLGGYAFGAQLVGLQNATYIEQTVNLTAGNTYLLTWNDAGRANYYDTAYDIYFAGAKLNASSFATHAGQGWSAHSLAFTAAGAGTLRFQGLAVNPDGTAFIDNLGLTAQHVPEPQSLALVTLALVGAGAVRRRKAAV